MDFKEIEKKWQFRWGDKFYEPKGKGRKFFVTFPYPYVNGAPHIGHIYTLFRVDVFARFKRMRGFDVLFPQSFHATGEPLVGAIERLRKGDAVQLNTFKASGATDEDIEKFKEDPIYAAKFWKRRWMSDLKAAAASIDWSRTFMTATPHYNKFIEWQYLTLRRKKLVVKGTHPVIWCPHDQSPTGDHDRLEGEGEYPVEHVLLKFEVSSLSEQMDNFSVFLVVSTLRPETVYGVTNIWVDENTEYVMAVMSNEVWIVSEKAFEKLRDQNKDPREIGRISGSGLLGKRAVNPVTNREIPILPGKFIETDVGTGIVMSVPSHAPYDWMAVKGLLSKPEEMERFGVTERELQPIKVVNTEGYGENPAADLCEKLGVKSLEQRDLLEKATKELYTKEFYQGTIMLDYGKYGGKSVEKSKDTLVKDFLKAKIADILFETSNKVVCRCGTRCHVKVLKNQWFLKYSDRTWKKDAKNHIKLMQILPEEARTNLLATIDWLDDKACARKSGLGTKLPWDKEWIVETLSDSTIYMAFYTIYGIIERERIAAENLNVEVFDYVFLGKNLAKARKSVGIQTLKKMRSEFLRWYPVDMRVSGKDLIQNHFAFFILHHIALFSKNHWPRGIGINGHVTIEGEKMSKSKGNVLLLKDMIDNYSSDLVRITVVGSGEGLDDANWSVRDIDAYRSRIEFILETANNLKNLKPVKERNSDKWLLSELQRILKETKECYEKLLIRTACNSAVFRSHNALKWYLRRCGSFENSNKAALEKFLSAIIRIISPLAPHTMEEAWHMLGKTTSVSHEEWPEEDENLYDIYAEACENLLKKIIQDVENVKRMISKKTPDPKKATIFVARKPAFKDAKEKAVQLSVLNEAKDFLSKELRLEVKIIDGDKSIDVKAEKATPEKPGIFIE
ncbi:MAG: leucine--tRNA ligase [Candidatus Aenigmarchaeota archaeon]|nr:leucine--tRNA ligase [Candidatus Aenigmarchaeota archaeon]